MPCITHGHTHTHTRTHTHTEREREREREREAQAQQTGSRCNSSYLLSTFFTKFVCAETNFLPDHWPNLASLNIQKSSSVETLHCMHCNRSPNSSGLVCALIKASRLTLYAKAFLCSCWTCLRQSLKTRLGNATVNPVILILEKLDMGRTFGD